MTKMTREYINLNKKDNHKNIHSLNVYQREDESEKVLRRVRRGMLLRQERKDVKKYIIKSKKNRKRGP